MADKKNFDDLTPLELEDIGREVWKARAAVNAAIRAAAEKSPDTDSLLLIASDYLESADERITAYI